MRKVAGRKKRSPRSRALRPLPWFAVRARVAVQLEGQRRGLQPIEDRIVIVRAFDHEDACARLEKEWREYATPYLNSAGERVRWQLEEIVGSYEMIDKINP